MSNQKVREMFEEWYEKNHQPNIVRVTESMGINYQYFMHWRKERKNMSDAKLKIINDFIK